MNEQASNIPNLLAGASAREAEANPSLAAARAAQSLGAARLPVPAIDEHFTKSESDRRNEHVRTEELIKKIENDLQNNMATFADLANQINIRQLQLSRLRSHQMKLIMARTMHEEPKRVAPGA